MTIKIALVPVNATAAGDASLATALALGRRFEAHVAALHVRPDPRYVMPYIGEGMSGVVAQEIVAAAEHDAAERAAKARALFERACEAAAVPIVTEGPAGKGFSASWREDSGREDEIVARAARLADVTIVAGRGAEKDAPPAGPVLEAVLLESGRPVLVVPPGGVTSFAERVAVAWNGSVEAARAVAAAFPFMQAATVAVLAVGPQDSARAQVRDLVRYLAWHGIEASEQPISEGGDGPGAALLGAAAALGCDLLVMGAYTHNRFRQMIFGGVTRHVLAHAELPVLVAH